MKHLLIALIWLLFNTAVNEQKFPPSIPIISITNAQFDPGKKGTGIHQFNANPRDICSPKCKVGNIN